MLTRAMLRNKFQARLNQPRHTFIFVAVFNPSSLQLASFSVPSRAADIFEPSSVFLSSLSHRTSLSSSSCPR